MLSRRMLVSSMLILAVVLSAMGQVRPAATEDLRSGVDPQLEACLQRLSRVEYQLREMQGTFQRIAQMVRVVASDDGEKVSRAMERITAAAADLRTSCENLTLRSRDGVDVQELCDDIDALVRSSGEKYAELKRLDASVRKIAMNVRRVAHAIRTTDASLIRASQYLKRGGEGQDAFPGLRRAFELQEEAKQALARKNIEAAMRLTLKARDAIGGAVQAALDSIDVAAVRQRARQYYARTNEMIEQVRTRTEDRENPRVDKLIRLASEQQERAREEMEKERPYRALRHAQAARRIVTEVAGAAQRAMHGDARVARLEARLEQARSMIEESDNDRASEVLEKGVQHLERAKELLDEGKDERATAEIDVAAKLIAKSVDLARGKGGRRGLDLRAEIRKTTLIVSRAESVARTERQQAQVTEAGRLLEQANEKAVDTSACLRLLDKATDIAFDVIAKAPRSGAPENETRPGSEER